MRRLLRSVAAYPADLATSALRGWDRFFFTPADPASLGLIRLIVGGLLLWNHLVLGLDLRAYLGADGWIGPEAVRDYLAHHAPGAWSAWFWLPDRFLVAGWLAGAVALALFAAGYASRLTAVLAWGIAVSTARRMPVALFGFDHMIGVWAFYLMLFGASGQALSVDRWLSARRSRGRVEAPSPTVAANLSLRLIQLHLAFVYGSAGLSKLIGPEWWDGTALQMVILTPEFRRFDFSPLLAYPSLLALGTHGALLLEILYPVLVWVPKLRPLVLASAILLHLGIDLVLGLTEFGLAMIAGNLAFVPGGWLRGGHAPAATGDAPPAAIVVAPADRPAPTPPAGRRRKGRAMQAAAGGAPSPSGPARR